MGLDYKVKFKIIIVSLKKNKKKKLKVNCWVWKDSTWCKSENISHERSEVVEGAEGSGPTRVTTCCCSVTLHPHGDVMGCLDCC